MKKQATRSLQIALNVAPPFFFCLCFILSLLMASALPAYAGMGRVEINQRHMADAPFHITEPGSYILTSPLVVTQPDTAAIWVSANHVSIDLNGFTITGPGNSANAAAILQTSPAWHHLTVRNGTIRSWGGDQCGVRHRGIWER